MQHHNDFCAFVQRLAVAGLLITAIATVLAVTDDLDVELRCDLQRVVRTRIVDEDDLVVAAFRQSVVGFLERQCRIVGRHDYHDLRLSNWRACFPRDC